MLEKLQLNSTSKVLIVGDVMLDQYWYGKTTRVSPEAPVPIVHVGEDEFRPGGAANVAINVAMLGAKPLLLGITGVDEAASQLRLLLENKGVDCHFVTSPSFKTITKLRVISQQQQLIRLDFEEAINHDDSQKVTQAFQLLLSQVDCVILSDYAKGTLSNVQELISIANQNSIPVLVDPKGLDFTKYKGASLLTPNYQEFLAAVGGCENEHDFIGKIQKLREILELQTLVVTRGDRGITLVNQENEICQFSANAREVFDVTGAGDTVISVLAVAMMNDVELNKAAELANLAAGIVVGKLGTASVTVDEINFQIDKTHLPKFNFNIVSHQQLVSEIAIEKARNKKIVFTNGCFDILHAGHLDCLFRAKELGDTLIVAVNSDESVKRLKGPDRPIVPLQQRMQLLAAIECVDWVVAFYEETPESLIADVLPDVLVKGGDYKEDDVAGSDCVKSNGGQVKILPYIEGLSTSHVVKKIAKTG